MSVCALQKHRTSACFEETVDLEKQLHEENDAVSNAVCHQRSGRIDAIIMIYTWWRTNRSSTRSFNAVLPLDFTFTEIYVDPTDEEYHVS